VGNPPFLCRSDLEKGVQRRVSSGKHGGGCETGDEAPLEQRDEMVGVSHIKGLFERSRGVVLREVYDRL
jgi:hypothetical protein